MSRRIVTIMLLAVFSASSAVAVDFRASVEANAARAAALTQTTEQQARHAQAGASDENPYLWPGIALIAAGAATAVYGFTSTSGAQCTFTETSLGCSETHRTGIGIAGLAVAVGGGVLLALGNSRKHKQRPELVFGPNSVAVRYWVAF